MKCADSDDGYGVKALITGIDSETAIESMLPVELPIHISIVEQALALVEKHIADESLGDAMEMSLPIGFDKFCTDASVPKGLFYASKRSHPLPNWAKVQVSANWIAQLCTELDSEIDPEVTSLRDEMRDVVALVKKKVLVGSSTGVDNYQALVECVNRVADVVRRMSILEGSQQLYCHCHQPFTLTHSQIKCDVCHEFMHWKCESLKIDQKRLTEDFGYTCNLCKAIDVQEDNLYEPVYFPPQLPALPVEPKVNKKARAKKKSKNEAADRAKIGSPSKKPKSAKGRKKKATNEHDEVNWDLGTPSMATKMPSRDEIFAGKQVIKEEKEKLDGMMSSPKSKPKVTATPLAKDDKGKGGSQELPEFPFAVKEMVSILAPATGIYHEARVERVENANRRVKIHFIGWAKRFDTLLPFESDRISHWGKHIVSQQEYPFTEDSSDDSEFDDKPPVEEVSIDEEPVEADPIVQRQSRAERATKRARSAESRVAVKKRRKSPVSKSEAMDVDVPLVIPEPTPDSSAMLIEDFPKESVHGVTTAVTVPEAIPYDSSDVDSLVPTQVATSSQPISPTQ